MIKDIPQNYIGLELPKALFSKDERWLEALEIDPDRIYPDLAGTLLATTDGVDLPFPSGWTYQIAADLNDTILQDEFRSPYMHNVTALPTPYKPVVHMPYNADSLALTGGFSRTLEKQFDICSAMNCDCIVIHPPRTIESMDQQCVDEFTRPQIKKLLRDTKITVCIENIDYSGEYYQSLTHLVEMRSKIVKKLEESGDGDVANYIKFTFDVGHYKIYRHRDMLTAEGDDRNNVWADSFEEFLKHTKVFHISSNDGTDDHHMLPFSPKKSIRVKGKFDGEQFQKNSLELLGWLRIAREMDTDIPERFWVLEIEPPFNLQDVRAFLKRLFS